MNYFWPQAIFLLKISSKISSRRLPTISVSSVSSVDKKIRALRVLRGSFRVPSVDHSECPPWIIQSALRGLFRVISVRHNNLK